MDRFIPMPVLININTLYDDLTVFFVGTIVAKNIQVTNESEDGLRLYCDENILRTMLRNAIGNAINHSSTGEKIILSATKTDDDFICTIKNQCSQSNFERFEYAFKNAGVQSGSHGLGLVLIKEFVDKIQASAQILYAADWVTMRISIPIKTLHISPIASSH